MSWTDSTTIKKHLFDLDIMPTEFSDIRVSFDGTGVAALPHKGLVSLSENVKVLAALEPTEQTGVAFAGETWVQLSYTNLLPDNIVVVSDVGMTTIYEQDKDYAVDWVNGKVRLIDGGNIDVGSSNVLYYLRYQIMIKDTDYTIDYDTGQITVKAGGSLEPETKVWVDYQIFALTGADQLIPDAITEAEDKILGNLKEDYDGSSQDQGLKTGATELTLAIISRGLASRALMDGLTSAEGRARAWRELALTYETSAWRTLRSFLKSPQLMKGLKRSNQSWEWS